MFFSFVSDRLHFQQLETLAGLPDLDGAFSALDAKISTLPSLSNTNWLTDVTEVRLGKGTLEFERVIHYSVL